MWVHKLLYFLQGYKKTIKHSSFATQAAKFSSTRFVIVWEAWDNNVVDGAEESIFARKDSKTQECN